MLCGLVEFRLNLAAVLGDVHGVAPQVAAVAGSLELERHVVVVEPESAWRRPHALMIDHGTDGRAEPGRAGERRWRHGAPWRGWWTRRGGDLVPRPHGFVQVVPDPGGPGIPKGVLDREGTRAGHVEAAFDPLPLRPQSIYVGVEQKEERILGGRGDTRDESGETDMGRAVRVAFHGPERPVPIARATQRKRVSFGEDRSTRP